MQLKKFATMKQERFRDNLGMDEWPTDIHEPMIGHSVNLGQFALLVKKDPSASSSSCSATIDRTGDQKSPDNPTTINSTHQTTKKQKAAPALQMTDWCPPGTSTVWSNQGSIHTCSDKLCRWNCLGLQGSLLASLLEQPMYMSSLTVGRKLTECICRRAVCCRAAAADAKKKRKNQKKRNHENMTQDERTVTVGEDRDKERNYKINHPAIMGTQVYMDETGVIDMSHHAEKRDAAIEGQDVRFHNSMSWAWWPYIESTTTDDGGSQPSAECIDGATGLALVFETNSTIFESSQKEPKQLVSRVSTAALLDLHTRIKELLDATTKAGTSSAGENMRDNDTPGPQNIPETLADLRAYKKEVSPDYETHKQELLTKHPLFRQWKRREAETL